MFLLIIIPKVFWNYMFSNPLEILTLVVTHYNVSITRQRLPTVDVQKLTFKYYFLS
jgi:hypothetical protein